MCSDTGIKVAKCWLVTYNFILLLMGAALMCVGIWQYFDDKTRSHLDTFKHLEETDHLMEYLIYGAMIVGAVVFSISFLGCCGALVENKCLLGLFMACLLLIMCAEVVGGICVLMYKDEFIEDIEGDLKNELKEYYGRTNSTFAVDFTDAVDVLQKDLECCGVSTGHAELEYASTVIRTRPQSCCQSGCVLGSNTTWTYYPKGCWNKFKDLIQTASPLLIGIGIGTACLELIGLSLALCVCKNVRDKEYYELEEKINTLKKEKQAWKQETLEKKILAKREAAIARRNGDYH